MFHAIFDMDGTILDTQRPYIPAWDYAGKVFGIENAGQYVPQLCGVNEAKSRAFIKENFPNVDPEEFRSVMREYLNKTLVVKYKKGAPELLDFLKEHEIKMAVASGSERHVISKRLSAVNGEHYFEAAVGGMDVQNGKPEPDIFLLAAQKLEVEPTDCFAFEDSENGIIAAHRAGMKVFGIPDLVEFSDPIKKLLFAEIESLDLAIPILKKYL